MQLLPGAITAIDLFKIQERAHNTGVVVVGGGPTECVRLASMDVVVGDIILVSANMRGTKGGLAGNVLYNMQKISGTATIQFVYQNPTCSNEIYISANDTLRITWTAIGRITVAGTLAIGSYGWSAGSNTTMIADEAQLYAQVIRAGI